MTQWSAWLCKQHTSWPVLRATEICCCLQQVDETDTDDHSEIARSEASTMAVWGPSSSLQQGPGSKRARQLMEMVQRSRPDRLTEAKLEAKVAADASSPAHNLRSHASRSPQQAVRSTPLAICSPPREPVQTKMVSFLVQTRAPASTRRVCTTPESYIRQAIDNGDSADLLRVSCALGFLLSTDGSLAEPHEAMSYIDDAVFAATQSFRNVATDLIHAVKDVLASGEEQLDALLDLILTEGLKGMRNRRKGELKRSGSFTSFLYHEIAAHEAPCMDSLARASFCLCMWTFLRGLLGDHKKPIMQVSSSSEGNNDFWISVRYGLGGTWRHFYPTERGVREMTVHAPASHETPANQPYTPLHLVGVMLQRFWAQALTAAVKRGSGSGSSSRQTWSGFCSKWLTLVLEFDRNKGLGLSESLAFVSCIRSGLEQGRIADRCLPDLLALVARHAQECAEVPVSPFHNNSGQPGGSGSRERKELWATYEALSTLVSMSGGAAGGPGSGGGGMSTHAVMRAADDVGQSAEIVMSRAHSALAGRR